MRRALVFTLILALTTLSIPTNLSAAAAGQLQGECVTIEGALNGPNADGDVVPLANHTVQLRKIADGQVVQTILSDAKGNFSFKNVYGPEFYVIEILSNEPASKGAIIGVSPKIEAGKDCRPIGGLIITASGVGGVAAGAAAAGAGFFTVAGLTAITAAGVGGFFVVKELTSSSQ